MIMQTDIPRIPVFPLQGKDINPDKTNQVALTDLPNLIMMIMRDLVIDIKMVMTGRVMGLRMLMAGLVIVTDLMRIMTELFKTNLTAQPIRILNRKNLKAKGL